MNIGLPAAAADTEDHNALLAIVGGDMTVVAKLYKAGILGEGKDAAILAAANGQLEIVEFLDQSGVDFWAIAGEALTIAAANGRLNVIRYLHRQGCDIRAGNDSPIRAAAEKSRLDVLEYLHRNGADIASCGSVVRGLLSSQKNAKTVEYLAQHGICPQGPAVMGLVGAIQQTSDLLSIAPKVAYFNVTEYSDLLLLAATERDDPRLLALLHERGCDLHAAAELALRRAAEKGHLGQLRYLHQNGCSIHHFHDLPLRLAARGGHMETVRYLVEQGCHAESVDSDSLTQARWANDEAFDYLTGVGSDGVWEVRPVLETMVEELAAAERIYQPSKLWEHFNAINFEQLRRWGMNGFKRNVNQNYFNFIPMGVFDPQLTSLLRHWLRNPSATFFRLLLVDPDVGPRTNAILPGPRRIFRALARFRLNRLARHPQMLLYRLMVSMLWDFVRRYDQTGLAANIAEPRLGSPIEIVNQGRLISQDLGHSLVEYNALAPALKELRHRQSLKITEIGAGYGRLAYVILNDLPCQYVIFDIPPSLAISQWYLSHAFPKKRIFHFRHFECFDDIATELAASEVAFFTPNQMNLFPDAHFDLAINISSLHELRLDQIDKMLENIYRLTDRFVYLKQYKEYINPYDNLRVLEDKYLAVPGWRDRFRQTAATDSRFFEALIEKIQPQSGTQPTQATGTLVAASGAADDGKTPTVSILLANYNHAEYLPTSLSGIVWQTYPASEVIIVDDGSTDWSIKTIERFAARYPSIKLLRNDTNRGQHASIQRALLAAKGDYIVWAASDDLLLPRFLERSLEMLRKHPKAGLCFSCLAVFVDGEAEVRPYTGDRYGAAFEYGDSPRYLSPQELDSVLRDKYIWMSGNTVVVRRSALLEMGGFEKSLRWHLDWFAYYVVALRYGACVVPETLALMRERPGTYSGSGISNPAHQGKVVEAILAAIRWPKYADIRPYFNRRPSLLSLFGKRGLIVAARNPRYWRIAWFLAWWHGPRYVHAKYHTKIRPCLVGPYHQLRGQFARAYHALRRRAAGAYRRLRRSRNP